MLALPPGGIEGDATLVIRGCLDALPVAERTGAPYTSTVPGVSHACGHDGQVAMLLGALALLDERHRASTVGLFQPAEEVDTGSRSVLRDRSFRALRPGRFLGFHGDPGLPAGVIAIGPGPVMASITTVLASIHGRGGHGAEPHLGADPISAAAALVLDWQVALSRRIDPRTPVVLSVGHIAAGATSNVIPDEAELEATLRTTDPAVDGWVEEVLRSVVRGVEARTGTRVELELQRAVPAVVNDPGLAGEAALAVTDLMGADALVQPTGSMGGDDFAWFLTGAPGLYVFIGEGQPGREPYGWHDPAYDLDERAVVVGAATLAAIAGRLAEGARR